MRICARRKLNSNRKIEQFASLAHGEAAEPRGLRVNEKKHTQYKNKGLPGAHSFCGEPVVPGGHWQTYPTAPSVGGLQLAPLPQPSVRQSAGSVFMSPEEDSVQFKGSVMLPNRKYSATDAGVIRIACF